MLRQDWSWMEWLPRVFAAVAVAGALVAALVSRLRRGRTVAQPVVIDHGRSNHHVRDRAA